MDTSALCSPGLVLGMAGTFDRLGSLLRASDVHSKAAGRSLLSRIDYQVQCCHKASQAMKEHPTEILCRHHGGRWTYAVPLWKLTFIFVASWLG